MSKVRVMVNPKFKGELFLPTINYSVKGGSILTLEEEDCVKGDIQTAIRNKWLVDPNTKTKNETETKPKEESKKKSEISSILKKADKVKFIDTDEDEDEEVEVVDPTEGEPKTTPIAWDAHKQKGVNAQKIGFEDAMKQLENMKAELEKEKATKKIKKTTKTTKKASKTKTVEQVAKQALKEVREVKENKASVEAVEAVEASVLPLPELSSEAEQKLAEDKAANGSTKSKKTIKRVADNNSEIE